MSSLQAADSWGDAYRTPERLRARIALHEQHGQGSEDIHVWLFDQLEANAPALPPGARVLEVGAGSGRMWQVAAQRVPPGWQLTLSDRSPGMLEAAESALADVGLSATFLEADAQDLPFPAGDFDLVFANHMLYHVTSPARAVTELRRVLTPGGVLVAATNGVAHMLEARNMIEPLVRVPGLKVDGVRPLSFTLESGAALLQPLFETVNVFHQDSSIVVDEPEPLLAYLRSLLHVPDRFDEELFGQLKEWEASVRAAFAGGPVRIQRRSGAFIAF